MLPNLRHLASPTVAAVLLCSGRQIMVERAVRCYRAQTYGPRSLLVFDNGNPQITLAWQADEIHVDGRAFAGGSIGALRNAANTLCSGVDILAHFDSDDWAHPLRLAEQVAFLQSSGKRCIGYRRALFRDTRPTPPEAWEYTAMAELAGYSIDASRCYWREFWQCRPMVDATFADFAWWAKSPEAFAAETPSELRMVCGIHGDNMSGAYRPDTMSKPEWRRAPEFDLLCASAHGGMIPSYASTQVSGARPDRQVREGFRSAPSRSAQAGEACSD